MPFEVGIWQENSLEGRFRVVEKSFKALALGAMMRNRGVPRRGGRSGIRIANEGEEPHPVAPMATMPPSSSISEQEFLVLQDSYQTFRLRIPGRLMHSDLIVNFSAYLSEATPEDHSSSSPVSASIQSSDILLGDMEGKFYRMPCHLAAEEQILQPQHISLQANLDQAESVQEVLPPVNCPQDRAGGQDSIEPVWDA